jgi:hypothetical protein
MQLPCKLQHPEPLSLSTRAIDRDQSRLGDHRVAQVTGETRDQAPKQATEWFTGGGRPGPAGSQCGVSGPH